MNKPVKYSPEVRDRAVRMVLEHQDGHGSQWAAIASIAGKIGCTAETLRLWVRRAERDQGKRIYRTTYPTLDAARSDVFEYIERRHNPRMRRRRVKQDQKFSALSKQSVISG